MEQVRLVEESHALRGTQVQVGGERGLCKHCWPALYPPSPAPMEMGWGGAGWHSWESCGRIWAASGSSSKLDYKNQYNVRKNSTSAFIQLLLLATFPI